METITISKKEYKSLKDKTRVDWALVNKIKRSLEDIKHGRFTEWVPAK